MTKSVFSNGLIDVYKGDREVTAGWMITNRETGKVCSSGHSLDRVKAEKTARSNLPTIHLRVTGIHGAYNRQYLAKKWGCTKGQALARAKAENDAEKAKYQIEIVDIK